MMDNIPGSELGDRDLILGRGLGKNHEGNRAFRALIKKWKYEYLDQPKADKPKIAAIVVSASLISEAFVKDLVCRISPHSYRLLLLCSSSRFENGVAKVVDF